METQLDAPPTLAVLARAIFGCVNPAFLGLFYTYYGSSVQSTYTQHWFGQGLLTCPSSATVGLPVHARQRATWRPTVGRIGVVWRPSPNKWRVRPCGVGARKWGASSAPRLGDGERGEKFDLSGTVARFGDILNQGRPIVEIGPRSVFANSVSVDGSSQRGRVCARADPRWSRRTAGELWSLSLEKWRVAGEQWSIVSGQRMRRVVTAGNRKAPKRSQFARAVNH